MAAEVTSPVTFNRDVLPILQKSCQSCHRPGQIAPMPFLSYQSTRPWAKAIKEAVLARKMPPWTADPRYGRFLNNPTLTQREIDTLAAWAESGAPEGGAHDQPTPVSWPDGWIIQPDVIVCLGATAAQSVFGPAYRVTKERGQFIEHVWARKATSTLHPSAILRARDEEHRHLEYQRFVADLKKVRAALESPAL